MWRHLVGLFLFKSVPLILLMSSFFIPIACNSCNINIGQNGTFSLAVSSSTAWLTSGPVAFRMKGKWWSTADGSLAYVKDSARKSTGKDSIGPYTEYSFRYQAAENVSMETAFKIYDTPSMVVFIQRFPGDLYDCQTDFGRTITAFPSFHVRESQIPLGYVAFGGTMFGHNLQRNGKWQTNVDIHDGIYGGPLLLYDESANSLIVSPYDNFMAASNWYDKEAGVMNWGIMGGVDLLPSGFESSTIAFCSSGIRETFSGWGRVLRQVYGKTDDLMNFHKSQDKSLNYLGYWTDNGAYYHYNTEPHQTYESTLLSVKEWADALDVPFRYFQLDSWFYPKGPEKGVITWDATKEAFPNGLKGFQEKLGLPLVAHNRFWSLNTTYAVENGGMFNFLMGKNASLPIEDVFWVYLLSRAQEGWGLIVYEQDWMNVQMESTIELKTSLFLGRMWLKQMADAALLNGQGIQYCMTLCRQAMQSVEFPAVTQGRVSYDYLHLPDQWKIGVTSHFAHALGVTPSKDTFWTTQKEPGKHGDKEEPWPTLQTVVAILSTGPVGPGDRLGLTNITRLMTCCDANGLILKPSVPARAIDDQFIGMAFPGSGTDGEVWSTYSTNLESLYGIILAANISRDVVISPQKAGFLAEDAPKFNLSVLYRVSHGKANILAKKINSSSEIQIKVDECSTEGEFFCVVYTSPIMNVSNHQIFLLGDLTKWVPMSEQRVPYIWQENGGLAVTLRGRENEAISFSYLMHEKVVRLHGVADQYGCATFTVIPGTKSPAPSHIDCTTKERPLKFRPNFMKAKSDLNALSNQGDGAYGMKFKEVRTP